MLAESGWKATHPSGVGCYCNQTGAEGANSTRTTYARECVVLRFRAIPQVNFSTQFIGGNMKVRKTVFAIFAVALLFASATSDKKSTSRENQRPCIVADGTAPLPPLPRLTQDLAATTVADGTAPLPPLPKRELQQA
jgi:hypothetical protein